MCQLTHIDNLAGNFWVKYLYLSVELEVAQLASILKCLHVHLDPSTNCYTHTAGNLKLYYRSTVLEILLSSLSIYLNF